MAADSLASNSLQEMCDVWVARPPSSLVFVLVNDGLPCPHKSFLLVWRVTFPLGWRPSLALCTGFFV